MSNTQLTKKQELIQLLSSEPITKRLNDILGKRASVFSSSIIQISNSSKQLQNCEPVSIINAAIIAATLDLPINPNLGFAYIIPFGKDAQFQIGYKGFIQLAMRSGQFKTIGAAPIYEGQLVSENPLTGFEFDFKSKTSEKVIGYAAYFKLINGFEKTIFMTYDELVNHGKRYSQTFKKDSGLWRDDFDAMAQKTVIKLLLSKFAPLSVEMQTAQIADQSVIVDSENLDVRYNDNSKEVIDLEELNEQKENQRILDFIDKADNLKDLETIEGFITTEELKKHYDFKKLQLVK